MTELQRRIHWRMHAQGLLFMLEIDAVELWVRGSRDSFALIDSIARREEVLSLLQAKGDMGSRDRLAGQAFRAKRTVEWRGRIKGFAMASCHYGKLVCGTEVAVSVYARREFSHDDGDLLREMLSRWFVSCQDTKNILAHVQTKFLKEDEKHNRCSTPRKEDPTVADTRDSSVDSERKSSAGVIDTRMLEKLMIVDHFLSNFGQVVRSLGFDGAELWIGEEGKVSHGGSLVMNTNHRGWADYSTAFEFRENESLVGKVLHSRRVQWLPDASLLPESIFKRVKGALKFGIKAMVGVSAETAGGVQLVVTLFAGSRTLYDYETKLRVISSVSGWARGSIQDPSPARVTESLGRHNHTPVLS
ncbi:hypothetical protein AAMO2058_000673800 [Amorphochlora amoebiformis]|eukprot:7713-Amorphochlora_amoeboformis.AAC.1